MNVVLDDARLVVDLMDGRTIEVPLAWYPRLANATPEQRNHWQLAGGGYGIHWPDIDEDLSTEEGKPWSVPHFSFGQRYARATQPLAVGRWRLRHPLARY